MNLAVLANILIFAAAVAWLVRRAKRGAPLSTNVLIALLLGVALGALAQAVYGLGSPAIGETVPWINVVGNGYVRLLQMIIAPLVLVSILAAVTRLSDARSLGAISALVLGLLMITTAISALIGIGMSTLFGLRADGIVQGARELERGSALEARVGEAANLTIPSLLQSFIPTNIFADLAGTRSTSVIGIVIFATLLGLAILALRREKPEVGERIIAGLDTLQHLVMRLVRLVIRLTPYGVLALMTRIVATSNVSDVINLGRFVVASYLGMGIILLMHALILTLTGLSPLRFYQKIWPVLTFAFTSRSSAAAIPLSVETQVSRLGVAPAIANFAASFGATIGQNACAGPIPRCWR
jgi:L-cystine uptake protein TcyP (sodium:dicarboxylate symporter family)